MSFQIVKKGDYYDEVKSLFMAYCAIFHSVVEVFGGMPGEKKFIG
jgi:hypothetical protein